MTNWPEFYFDSEFESASEYSTHTSDSSPVPNCQVTLSLLWNHDTQSYQQNSCRPEIRDFQPQVDNHQSQPLKSGVRKHPQKVVQPSNGVQIQPENSQPLKICVQSQPRVEQYQFILQPKRRQPQKQPLSQPRSVARVQPHNGEKRQPLIVGIQSQPPDAYQHRDQPNRQPPWQPAKKNQPPKMQPPAANGVQVQSAKSQHLNSGVKPPDVDMQKQPPNTGVKSRSQRQPHNGIRSQPSAANFQNQPPDLPPDPDPEMRVIKEDWG